MKKEEIFLSLLACVAAIILLHTDKHCVISSAFIEQLERMYEVAVLCQTAKFWDHSL